MKPIEICRTCLRQDATFTLIYETKKINDETLPLTDLLRLCCGIPVAIDDNLSPLVCHKCIIEICRAYSFRQQSRQADAFLRKRNVRLKFDKSNTTQQRSLISKIEERISGINQKDASQRRVTKSSLDLLKEKVKQEDWKKDTVDTEMKHEHPCDASYAPSEWDMDLDIELEDDFLPAPKDEETETVNTSNKILQTISANRKRDEEQKQKEIEKRKNEIELQRKKRVLNEEINCQRSNSSSVQQQIYIPQNGMFWNGHQNLTNFQSHQIETWDYKTKIEQWKRNTSPDNLSINNDSTEIIEINQSDVLKEYQRSTIPKIEIIKMQNFDVDDLISVSEYAMDETVEDIEEVPIPELPTSSNSQETHTNELTPITTDDLAELLLTPATTKDEQKNESQEQVNRIDNSESSENNNKITYEPPNDRRCHICNLILSSSRKLKYHMEVRHLKSKTYLCNYCGEGFSSPDQSRAHIKITHFPESLAKCRYCDKKFISLFQVTMHERKHTGERPFQCDICNYSATQLSALKVHNRTHTGERPYKCDTCNATFRTSARRSEHMRSHKKYPDNDSRYTCNICGKTNLWRTGALKAHMESHKPNKAFKCNLCLKYFSSETFLKRHNAKEHKNDNEANVAI